MKRKNMFFVIGLMVISLITIQSCKQDEPTVQTQFTNTIPTVVAPVASADGTVFIASDSILLKWSSDNKGAANKWNVYFSSTKSPALYKSNINVSEIKVPVADGITYYWKVESTDLMGVTTTSPTFTFTAIKGTNPKMTVNMTCKTDVSTAIGVNLNPDEVVQLRLLILKKSDMSIVKTIDNGTAGESFRDFETLPDDEYVLGVDVASTLNAGELNKPVTLSLSLSFVQKGVINETLDFANVMTNENPCSLYRTELATVKKTGAKYTISSALHSVTPDVVTWKGKDDVYASQVSTTSTCTATSMAGLGFGWMADYWGEVIVSGGTLEYSISGNTITIPLQKYCKTTYKGAAQPEYSISGTGTIDNSGTYPVWTIHYDFIQSGSTILTAANGVPAGYLEAVITTDPSASSPVKQFTKSFKRK